jgi:hypothetical protein
VRSWRSNRILVLGKDREDLPEWGQLCSSPSLLELFITFNLELLRRKINQHMLMEVLYTSTSVNTVKNTEYLRSIVDFNLSWAYSSISKRGR